MATWNDIYVKQATANPDWTTSATVTLGSAAAEGNKLVLFVTASANATATTAPLTSAGWTLDQTFTSSQTTYILSRSVPAGGITSVTVGFLGSNKPVLRLIELTGISLKHASITNSGSASTGTLVTTTNDTVVFGLVSAVINGGEPTYDTWTNSFTSIGTLRSFASTPYDLPSRVAVGISQFVTTNAGSYSSAVTMAGTGGPAVLDVGGLAIAYQIGATTPTVDAGVDSLVALDGTFNRTATENDGDGTITARAWTVQAGPAGVGDTIGASAALSWVPTTAGVYTLRYSATNSAGTGHDDVQLTVIAPVVTTGSSSPIDVSLQPSTYRSRIRAEGPGGVSAWSAWSDPFVVSSGELALPRIAWEGGSDYWSQFTRASTAGWTDPSFFPISVFFGSANPTHVSSLKDAGVNLYMGVEHSPEIFPMANITGQGMYTMPSLEWTPAEVGNDNRVVGWSVSDEIEMGMGIPGDLDSDGDSDEYDCLIQQLGFVNEARGYNDGRFVHANFGNGILRTFWSNGASPNYPGKTTMYDHVALMDVSSADKYTYTSPDVANIIDGVHDAPDWPNGTPVQRAYSYGWQADQMRRFQNQSSLKPVWTFVETARPYLNEAGAGTITPDQIEGAVWSALIHEARGIAYFQHNNDNSYGGNYSIVQIPAVHAKVKAINEKVLSLAPVLNTQSYYNTSVDVNGFTYHRYSFANGTDTMVKTHGGFVYIFAGLGMGDATGSKTFTVPAGVSGNTVDVVGESRTIPVAGGQFSDTFTYEYTHHVYKIAL